MRWRWWYVPLYPVVALATVAAFLLGLLIYRIDEWRFRAGCFEFVAKRRDDGVTRIWGRPGGQSLGCPVIAYAGADRWENAGLRVHERCHAVQGIVINAIAHAVLVPLVPLVTGGDWYWWVLAVSIAQLTFGVLYGGHFFALWLVRGFGDWKEAYYRIVFERQAYRIQDEFNAGERKGAWGA